MDRFEVLVGEISSQAIENVAEKAMELEVNFELASTSRKETRDQVSTMEAKILEVKQFASEDQLKEIDSLLGEAKKEAQDASDEARVSFNGGNRYYESLSKPLQEEFAMAAPALYGAIREYKDRQKVTPKVRNEPLGPLPKLKGKKVTAVAKTESVSAMAEAFIRSQSAQVDERANKIAEAIKAREAKKAIVA